MEKKVNNNNKRRIIVATAVFLIAVMTASVIYVNTYYHADPEVEKSLTSSDKVKVTAIEQGMSFTQSGNSDAFIFYPGAKVEYIAYAPLMAKLTEEGIDCYLIKMPCNLAFLGKDLASEIMNKYSYENYYLGGHSLGGAMAAVYATEHDRELKGLILLAAYPTKSFSNEDFQMLSIYGTNDGVLNVSKYNEMKTYWPKNTVEHQISGGNHAYYGNYGPQKGDNEATISRTNQQEETVNTIEEWVEKVR